MSHALPPQTIRRIREALGLSSSQFAGVLGVHPTTVSRWETSRQPLVAVEGTAWTVLSSIAYRLDQDTRAHAAAHAEGQKIAEALLVAGAIVALAHLVAFAANK